MKRAAKKDKNHNEIKKAMEAIGAYVHDTHQLKEAFDCVVAFRGKVFIMEIKNPEYLPKTYGKERLIKSLEDGEKKCMGRFERVGVVYHIVTTVEQALEIIKT